MKCVSFSSSIYRRWSASNQYTTINYFPTFPSEASVTGLAVCDCNDAVNTFAELCNSRKSAT